MWDLIVSVPDHCLSFYFINWQQFTEGTRSKPNEQLFPRQVAIQLPKIY